MATQPPLSFFDGIADSLAQALQPPVWLVDEVQRRVVLVVTPVLTQEPAAQARMAGQSGRVVAVRWRQFTLALVAPPAGLFALAAPASVPDLAPTLPQAS